VGVVTQAQEQERCISCGVPIAVKAEPLTISGRTIRLRQRVCEACAAAAVTSESSSTPPKSKWQRLCPPLYQRDLPVQLRARAWVSDALNWQFGSQGLLVVGSTGTGKTWVMWHLLRRLLDEQRSVVVLDAVTYRSRLANAAREGETEEYVRRLTQAELLYWDDFGQTNLSGAASEMLLHLLEQRTACERPLLLTSQYSGGALESQFQRPEMGAAVRRRLNEFCRVIVAD
jgi:Cdc6-like AAA superfamily ATPase